MTAGVRVSAPYLFASLIGEGANPARGPLTVGYIIGAGVMVLGGLIAWFFGVDAERQSLENIAKPLSAREHGGSTRFQGATRGCPVRTSMAASHRLILPAVDRRSVDLVSAQ